MITKVLKACAEYSMVLGYAVSLTFAPHHLRTLLFIPVFMGLIGGYEWCIENGFISTDKNEAII